MKILSIPVLFTYIGIYDKLSASTWLDHKKLIRFESTSLLDILAIQLYKYFRHWHGSSQWRFVSWRNFMVLYTGCFVWNYSIQIFDDHIYWRILHSVVDGMYIFENGRFKWGVLFLLLLVLFCYCWFLFLFVFIFYHENTFETRLHLCIIHGGDILLDTGKEYIIVWDIILNIYFFLLMHFV